MNAITPAAAATKPARICALGRLADLTAEDSFIDSTGRTQGMIFRIRPPTNAIRAIEIKSKVSGEVLALSNGGAGLTMAASVTTVNARWTPSVIVTVGTVREASFTVRIGTCAQRVRP
jgi:hypothetical protein